MDHRILLAAVVGLVLVAFGGFYYALTPRSYEAVTPPARTADAAPPARTADAPPLAAPVPAPASATPAGRATPESMDAELARSEHAELQALLKQHFADEYKELVAIAVRRRNEGVSEEESGRELLASFQDIMRPKLKFAVAASMATIDNLAANEVGLFQALAAEGAPHCRRVLGKDDAPVTEPLPDSVRRMMQLGTLYRFQAIVDGMPKFRPVDQLRPDEMNAFEAALTRSGLSFEDVRTGAFLDRPGEPQGGPCLKIQKLYEAIAGLPEETRRKLYSGMFFLGRDK
jgi:hypothetical protein